MAETAAGSGGSDGRASRTDAALNLVGNGVAGVSGFLLLALIGGFYGAEELGRFSIVFAAYLVISQVTTLAIHHGVLHHLGVVGADAAPRRQVLLGAVGAVCISAATGSIALWTVAPSALEALGRSELLPGLRWAIAAAAVFSVNKVLMSALNALARFRALALASGSRGVVLIGAGLGVVLTDTPASDVAAALLITEAILCTALIGMLREDLRRDAASLSDVLTWTRQLLAFGIRGAAGGVLMGINARVDVLCLSAFVDDRSVGIYTIAALLAEAVLQIPVVVRSLLSPSVVRLLAARDSEGLGTIMRRVRRRLSPAMAAVCIATWAAFPLLVALLQDPGFSEARASLAILGLGVWASSATTPFNLMLAQGGDASAQSWLLTAVVSVNITGNLLLIPILGIEGSAVATALSMVIGAVLIRPMVRRRLALAV
jgi:O-antigen/teichoic acid export membrane protein